MTTAITGVDHCVILVRDLDAARDQIAALGFTVTPRGTHSEHMGTANHCIMLRRGYFELLSVLRATELNIRWRRRLEVREGLAEVALATDDVNAVRDELAARGVAPSDPIGFSRPVNLPEGRRRASFRVISIPEQCTPGASMFVCQHLTREVVWRPDYLSHANGARGLKVVTAVNEEPEAIAPAYEKMFGADRVRSSGGTVIIEIGAGRLRFVTPTGFNSLYPGVTLDGATMLPYLAALSLEVEDRGATAAFFAENGVPHTVLPNGSICLSPAHALGTLLEYV